MRTAIISFLVIVGILVMYGCGASALEANVKAAQTVRTALDVSKSLIERAAEDSATAEMRNEAVDVQQAELNAHEALRQYEAARALQNKAVTAYEIWVTSLLSAYSKEENPSQVSIWYSAAMAAFEAYKELVIESIKVGLKLPSIDNVMKGLQE